MFKALYNGSYISQKNTGIGEVSERLLESFTSDKILLLDPFDSDKKNTYKIPSNLSPGSSKFAHIRRLFWIQKNIPSLMKKYKAQYFISPLPEAPLFSNISTIVLIPDLIPLRYPKLSFIYFYYLFYVPLVLYQSKLVLCISKATATEVNKKYKIPFTKLKILKLGFNKKEIYPQNLKREKFFLVIGRHNKYKNLKRLLIAFKSFNHNDYQLIFVGPCDKRYTPGLKELSKELNIEKQCIWKNWVSDDEKLNLLNSCKALYLISLWEGFGLPALEALACGTPVVASNTGAVKEILEGNGILVNPKNVEEIKDSMNKVINEKDMMAKFSKLGPNISSKYDWKESAKTIEKIIID